MRSIFPLFILMSIACSDPSTPSSADLNRRDRSVDDPQPEDATLNEPNIEDMGAADRSDTGELDLGLIERLDSALPPLDMIAPLEDLAVRPDASIEIPCDPDEPIICEGWVQKRCRMDGSGYELISCEDGQVCHEDRCVEVHPNVIFVVDTSGSMNSLIEDESAPDECEGEGCPPWSYPMCDDPAEPLTRLGRVKRALHSVMTHESSAQVRLALQKFPQTEGLHPLPYASVSCNSGWYANHDSLSRHFSPPMSPPLSELSHELDIETFAAGLSEVIPVPLDARGHTQTEALFKAIDFQEHTVEVGPSCRVHSECPDGFCQRRCDFTYTGEFGDCEQRLGWGVNTQGICVEVSGCECTEECEGRVFESQAQCQNACGVESDCRQGCGKFCRQHDNPELRAIGSTPIGQSLFYAGEYFRHYIIKEGVPCAQSEDCGSADYECVNQRCHDPLVECRPNIIVLFSDGRETDHDDPESFFNPRVQAKRFHYGLGCRSDDECLNQATCLEGRCAPPIPDLSQRICKGADLPCTNDDECPEYQCGLGMSCAGECAEAGFDYIDQEGHNLLRTPSGHTISLRLHVVDASGDFRGNSLLAQIGGGVHASVDFTMPEQLIQQLTTLIGAKAEAGRCR